MKGEVGAQRGGWSFERRDWSLLMEVERLELTDGEVGALELTDGGGDIGAY